MDLKKIKLTKKGLTVLIISLCILVPIIAYGSHLAYVLYFSDTPTIVNTEDPEQNNNNELLGIPSSEESGIENIVLFGVDNRTPTDHGRTDSIIIATIDKNSKVLKLTSIMRDLFVEVGSPASMNRVNAAYAFGGPELALETLNKNFGLDLKYYAIIDFKAFQELVDKLGGVDVEVKDYEVNEINFYIKEVNGANATLLKKSGFIHLNGQQALSYARIRKVGNGDYERTERQKAVLKSLLEQAKKVNVLKVPDIITTLASYAQTNVPLSKIVSLGVTVYGFGGSTESMRIPVDGYYQGQSVHGSAVLVPDIKANAMFLKEFMYNMKFAGNKNMPAYAYNNFHMDDSDNTVSSMPKPNIPDYSTPEIPTKPEEEQSNHSPTPVVIPGTEPTTTTGGKTDTTTPTTPGEEQGTQPPATDSKPGTSQPPAGGDKPGTSLPPIPGGNSGPQPATN